MRALSLVVVSHPREKAFLVAEGIRSSIFLKNAKKRSERSPINIYLSA